MRRRAALVVAVLFALACALFAAAAWLAATPTGTRLALQQLQRWLPGLHIDAVEGSALGPLTLRGLRYEDATLTLTIDQAYLDWNAAALLSRRLRVRQLQAGHVMLTIRPQPPQAQPPPQGPPLTRLPIGLSIAAARVAQLDLQLPDAAPLQFRDIALTNSRWIGPRVRVESFKIDWSETGPLAAQAALHLRDDGIDIDRLVIAGPGRAELQGRYRYDDASDLKLSWQALRWPLLETQPLLRSERGELQLEGRRDDYRLQLRTALTLQQAPLQLQARAQGGIDTLRLESLQARALGGRLQAQGELAWSPQLRLQARAQFRHLDPGTVWPQLAAQLSGEMQADTRLVDGRPQIDFSAGLRDSVWRGNRIQLAATGRYADDLLRLHAAELQSAGSRLQLAGLLWPRLDARADISSPDLSPLWPQLGGRLQAQLQARGPLAGPGFQARVQAQTLRYGDYGVRALQLRAAGDLRGRPTLDTLKLDATLDARGLHAGELTLAQFALDAGLDLTAHNRLQVRAENLQLGEQRVDATAELRGRLRDHRLQLAAQASEFGRIELSLQGAADLARRRWQGALSDGRYAPPELAAWQLQEPAALELSRERQALVEPACWLSRPARACFRVVRGAQGQRLAFRLEDFAFNYLKPLLPPQWSVDGRLHGTAQLDFTPAGDPTFINADLHSSAGRWRINEQEIFQFQPATVQARQDESGRLQALADLPFADGRARFEAQLAPGALLLQRALTGSLQVDLPQLAWLRVFTPEVIGVQGQVHGRFTLAGSLAQPTAEGALQLRDGRLRLARPGIAIEDLNGSLRGAAGKPLQLAVSGRSGGGELRAEGVLDLQAEPMAAQLRIVGNDFQAARLPDARVWISPDLKLRLQQRHLEVSGDVRVPRAELTPRGEGSGIAPSDDQIIVTPGGEPPEPAGLITHHARLRLQLGDKVRFQGFGLKAPLTGELTLIQDSGSEARAQGEIRLDGGRYKAYGQDLSITTGRLIYSGGFVSQPALDLRAERKPDEDITVGVTVRGTLEKPQFTLYSSPAMTQPEQLSWLVLGRPLEKSGSEGDRARLSGAALALGLTGGDFLAQRLRSSLGLDEISIGAKPTETSEQARLTIGKYLSPKLYISYGIGLFQPGNIFKLTYELGRGFKVQTESGVQSGGDLLYTIER